MIDDNRDFVGGDLPFYYVMVVWGEKYVDMLLGIALPCLLAPGNLPALENLSESRFLIVTTPRDRTRIAISPIFKLLTNIIHVDFVSAPWIDEDGSRYAKASRGHKEGAKIAAENAAYCVYLVPDIVLPNNALEYLVKIARAGKKAVMIPGIRVVTETMLKEINNSNFWSADGVLNFSARDLVAIGLRHVHISDQRYNWEHPAFSKNPVVCTWSIPEEDGLLIRAFHLHPILVKIGNVDSLKLLDNNTIDDEFLGLNFPNWDAIHVETDSDNLMMFTLTDQDDRYSSLEANRANVEKLRAVAYSDLSNPLHRYYFTKAIKLHSADLNEKWSKAEKDTGLLAYNVLSISKSDMSELLQYVDGRTLLRALVEKVVRRLERRPRK